jgi:hypothetical protein
MKQATADARSLFFYTKYLVSCLWFIILIIGKFTKRLLFFNRSVEADTIV